MSVESHLEQLREKHRGLDARIRDEERRPGVSSTEITALKREKLLVKEEIQRLSELHH